MVRARTAKGPGGKDRRLERRRRFGSRYWVGFDVGKAFHWVCVLDEEGEVVLSRRVEAEERGIEDCCEEIESLGGEPRFGIDLLGGPAALLEAVLLGRGERVLYLPGTAVNRARDGYRGEHKSDRPMLDLLWRSAFRWRLRPRRVTGDAHFGTLPNVRAVEEAGIKAYMPVTNFPRKNPGFFGKEEFLYGEALDAYRCPSGELLRPTNRFFVQGYTRYRAQASACNACPLKPRCTDSGRGRTIARDFGERYVERARSYRGTHAYEKAMPKRRVWVEPLFAEAKDWHGMRRFRLRRLERVNAEALMIAAGQNLKRLLEFGGRGPGKLAQSVALSPPERVALHRRRHRHGAWQGRSSTASGMHRSGNVR